MAVETAQCGYSAAELDRHYAEVRSNTCAMDPARLRCWVNPDHPSHTDPEHPSDSRWRHCPVCEVSWYAGLMELPL